MNSHFNILLPNWRMVRNLSLFFFLMGFYTRANACICSTFDSELSYKNSDLVFIGKVRYEDFKSKHYEFEIIEILKGDYRQETIKGSSGSLCSLSDFDKSTWLVYTNFEKDSTIDISRCSGSRSYDNPFYILPLRHYDSGSNEIDSLKNELAFLKMKNDALLQLFKEIETFRERRVGYGNNSIKTTEIDWKHWMLVLNLIGLAVVIWFLFKRRNTRP